jgi:PHD/YefM family antitoxin component YafN of YafNO toxin-antitoxin module
MSAEEAGQDLDQILDQIARTKSRVIIERDGKQVGAIISVRDLARLAVLDAQYERDVAVLKAASAAFADVSEEEIEREVARAIAEVRAENRARQRQAEANGS